MHEASCKSRLRHLASAWRLWWLSVRNGRCAAAQRQAEALACAHTGHGLLRRELEAVEYMLQIKAREAEEQEMLQALPRAVPEVKCV